LDNTSVFPHLGVSDISLSFRKEIEASSPLSSLNNFSVPTMPHNVQVLLAHIKQLETRLKSFEQHHQSCSLAPERPPIEDDSDVNDPSGLRIVLERPHPVGRLKPPKANQKWTKAADQLLQDVPSAENLVLQTTQSRPDKGDLGAWVIAHICGFSAHISSQTCEQPTTQADGLFALARRYARGIKFTQDNIALIRQIQTFRELVFVSLCAVLETLDYTVDDINEIMREWLSNSGDANLHRLRKGAIWANHRISELDVENATEWFFSRLYFENLYVGIG